MPTNRHGLGKSAQKYELDLRHPQSLTADLLQESNQRHDAQLEVLQMVLLVGSVDVVVRQAKAHHHAGSAQVAVKVAHDGDGAAGTDENRILAPHLVQS